MASSHTEELPDLDALFDALPEISQKDPSRIQTPSPNKQSQSPSNPSSPSTSSRIPSPTSSPLRHRPTIPLTWSQKVLAREKRDRQRARGRTGMGIGNDGFIGGEDRSLSDCEDVIKVSMQVEEGEKNHRRANSMDGEKAKMGRRLEVDKLVFGSKKVEKSIRDKLDQENLPTPLPNPLPFPPSSAIHPLNTLPRTMDPYQPKKVYSTPALFGIGGKGKWKAVGKESDDPFFQPSRYDVLKGQGSMNATNAGLEAVTNTTSTPALLPASSSLDPTTSAIALPDLCHPPLRRLTPSPPPLRVIDLTQTPLAKRRRPIGNAGFTPRRIDLLMDLDLNPSLGGLDEVIKAESKREAIGSEIRDSTDETIMTKLDAEPAVERMVSDDEEEAGYYSCEEEDPSLERMTSPASLGENGTFTPTMSPSPAMNPTSSSHEIVDSNDAPTSDMAAETSHHSEHSTRIYRRPARRAKILFSSDEEDVGVRVQEVKKPAKKVKVLYSSDEEEENVPIASPRKSMQSQPIIDVSSGDEEANNLPPQKGKDKANVDRSKQKRQLFIDDFAGGSEDEEEGGEDYDSEGSLRDFIVDDDYESEEGDEEEDEDEDAVLRFSPGNGKPAKRAVPQTSAVTLDSSDEEEVCEIPKSEIPKKKKGSQPPQPKSSSKDWLTAPARNRNEKREWKAEKVSLAQDLVYELDENVFGGGLKAGTGEVGVKIVWSVNLRTTAGRASHKRSRQADGSYIHHATIELSEKVLDTKQKVLNTVAHELCHLASWLISKEMKNPHGSVFKSWASKIMRVRRDIVITTKHSYVIEYKYEWRCSDAKCGLIYRRHSKSIDINKHACGRCKSKLVPLFGQGAGSSGGAASGAGTPRKASAFQEYLKLHMKTVKASMPGKPHGEIMRALSEMYKAEGGGLAKVNKTPMKGRSMLSMALDLTLSD